MLVHLGGDVSVLQKKIVAVLELNGELTEDTQDFYKDFQGGGLSDRNRPASL